MFSWKDKQNGVDDVLAEDINKIARAIIELEKNKSNYYTKSEIDIQIGDIETALDHIIALQGDYIGGDSE